MKRIRGVGLAAVLALSLTAFFGVASASASPSGVWVNEGKFEAESTSEVVGAGAGLFGGPPLAFKFFGDPSKSVWGECSEASFKSQVHEPVFQILAFAKYGGCKYSSGGLSIQANMNGCFFIFDARGPVTTGCKEAGEAVEFSISLFGSTLCTAKIPEQVGLEGTGYTNFGEGSSRGFWMSTALNSVEYTLTGEGCAERKPGTYNDGVMFQRFKVTGQK